MALGIVKCENRHWELRAGRQGKGADLGSGVLNSGVAMERSGRLVHVPRLYGHDTSNRPGPFCPTHPLPPVRCNSPTEQQ